jgi:hypothetical protein
MACQGGDAGPGGHVPQADLVVTAAGGEQGAVGAERYAEHQSEAVGEGGDAGADLRVPQPDGSAVMTVHAISRVGEQSPMAVRTRPRSRPDSPAALK